MFICIATPSLLIFPVTCVVPSFQVSSTFLIVGVLFFIIVAKADSLAVVNPANVVDGYISGSQFLLQFGVLSFIFLLLAGGMWLYHVFVERWFLHDTIGQFTDLCSLSNVSLIILEDKYHGYYIHGRAVHGFADTDMWEMRTHLRKEEEDITGYRGLLPNTNRQTFEIHIPVAVRDQWDKVLMNVLLEEPRDTSRKPQCGPSDRSLQAYTTLNRFLSAFVDHSFKELDYVVQDNLFFQRLIGHTPKMLNRGVFYNDDNHSFDQVLLYGRQMPFFMFLLLRFALLLYLTNSWVGAGFFAYFTQLVLIYIRKSWGKTNLAGKTLIDHRFLI